MLNSPLSYILLGHPVSHSLSPKIHAMFAAQFNLKLSYTTQDVNVESFVMALEQFRAQGGLGANITVPLKEVAYTACQHKSIQAQRAQAVNTIYWDKNNQLCGHNTDGIGLLRDLKNNYQQKLAQKNILILGAGGAAAGIIPVLLQELPKAIYITNRTEMRAINLVKKLNHDKIQFLSMDALNTQALMLPFDIIINATSASLYNDRLALSPSIIKNQFIYDLVYNLERPTAFVQWAREHGAKEAHDGLGMLIEQAAESFYLWHKKRPDTEPVHLFFRHTQKDH